MPLCLYICIYLYIYECWPSSFSYLWCASWCCSTNGGTYSSKPTPKVRYFYEEGFHGRNTFGGLPLLAEGRPLLEKCFSQFWCFTEIWTYVLSVNFEWYSRTNPFGYGGRRWRCFIHTYKRCTRTYTIHTYVLIHLYTCKQQFVR